MARTQPESRISPNRSLHETPRATPDAISLGSTSPRSTSSVNGTKRKRSGEPKFYSVRVGQKPGIYNNWNDCLAQVKGYKGAIFKSFPSLADAQSFLSGHDPSQNPASSLYTAPKFYAVRNGLVPGVYTDWPSAQRQIVGCTKPKHRCFSTRADAEAFVEGTLKLGKDGSSDGHASDDQAQPRAQPVNGTERLDEVVAIPPKKQRKTTTQKKAKTEIELEANADPTSYPPGTGPLPVGAVDDFDPNILMNPKTGLVEYKTAAQKALTTSIATGLKDTSVLRIYTDGSSRGNGKTGATAGVGVYFGSGDERNISEALAGPRQTNQRAELTAILRALDIAPKHREVAVYTDSRYAIDCVTTWYINWRKNNWRTSAGKAVENRDLIEDILGKIETRKMLGVETKFVWLKGHADDPGNVAADALAINGARKAHV